MLDFPCLAFLPRESRNFGEGVGINEVAMSFLL